jgi:YHS domain-containing protein
VAIIFFKEHFMRRSVAVAVSGMFVAVLMFGMGCRHEGDDPKATGASAEPMTQSAKQNAVDLGNTVCPVSGDKVGDSKLTEVYQGKIYHFCCDDCPKDFKKDPDKFAKKVAADPAKYGVKQGS